MFMDINEYVFVVRLNYLIDQKTVRTVDFLFVFCNIGAFVMFAFPV